MERYLFRFITKAAIQVTAQRTLRTNPKTETYINFENMTEDTVVIADEVVATSALELLPFLVSDTDDYFPGANLLNYLSVVLKIVCR